LNPCGCENFSSNYKTGDCRVCWLYNKNSIYRKLWDSKKFEDSIKNFQPLFAGGGVSCGSCDDTCDTYTLTVSGVTNFTCLNCSGYNGTFTLNRTTGCNWLSAESATCPSSGGNAYSMSVSGSTWTILALTSSGSTIKQWTATSVNCLTGETVFTESFGPIQSCNFPLTVTLTANCSESLSSSSSSSSSVSSSSSSSSNSSSSSSSGSSSSSLNCCGQFDLTLECIDPVTNSFRLTTGIGDNQIASVLSCNPFDIDFIDISFNENCFGSITIDQNPNSSCPGSDQQELQMLSFNCNESPETLYVTFENLKDCDCLNGLVIELNKFNNFWHGCKSNFSPDCNYSLSVTLNNNNNNYTLTAFIGTNPCPLNDSQICLDILLNNQPDEIFCDPIEMKWNNVIVKYNKNCQNKDNLILPCIGEYLIDKGILRITITE
jgi:hypothetical protein